MNEEELKQAKDLMDEFRELITKEVTKSLDAFRPKTKCPICEGKGQVSSTFYYSYENHSTGGSPIFPVNCRSCNGSGLI
jgi:DnaJ-class molecular chaperone